LKIKPKIAIPMHFKEKDTNIGVNTVNSFENLAIDSYPVKKFQRSAEIAVLISQKIQKYGSWLPIIKNLLFLLVNSV
jgi:hypothetical protein